MGLAAFHHRRSALSAALLVLALGSRAAPAHTQADLFDDNVLHEIRIRIHPSDWQRLKARFVDNTYYPCNLEWRGLVVENIGIRSRGRTTRNGVKPGLRVDFNRYEQRQEFLGLKSLVLDNMIQDASMLKERTQP